MRELYTFAAVMNPARRGVEIWAQVDVDNVRKNVTKIEISSEPEQDHLTIEPPPPLYLSYESAQSLMDALWASGVKPSGGEGHTAHIRALNAHLDDMRRLVFEANRV